MSDSYSIHIARERDNERITRLLIDTFSHLYQSLGLEMTTKRRMYLSDQASRRSFATSLIYVVDGEAAGAITLVPPSQECKAWIKGAWEVRLLAVSPAMQGAVSHEHSSKTQSVGRKWLALLTSACTLAAASARRKRFTLPQDIAAT